MNDTAMGLRLDVSQVNFGIPEVALVGVIGPMLSKTSGAMQGGGDVEDQDVTYISLEFVRRTEGEPDLRVIKSEIIADKTDRNEGVISFVTIGEVVVAGNKYQYLVVVVKHKLYKKDAPWIISKAYLSPPEPFQDPRDKDVVALWRQRAVDLLD